ncbi:hypothetical protein GCM10023238_17960 [Streptomyces heliomycini]
MRIADDGEIWLHGDNVFAGYLNDPGATAGPCTTAGCTGDLGSLDEDGYLTLTGRKKEILVTSGGKSVSPGVLEERVRDHPLVDRCIVVGNDRPYVAALSPWTRRPSSTGWRCAQTADVTAELVRDTELETEVRRAVVTANTLVSQAAVDPHVPHPGTAVHRGARAAHAVAQAEAAAIEKTYATEVEALYRHEFPVRNASRAVIVDDGGNTCST